MLLLGLHCGVHKTVQIPIADESRLLSTMTRCGYDAHELVSPPQEDFHMPLLLLAP